MASSGITAVHFSTIRIEGSLVLLPGACGTIEASRDVQPLSARDWELPQGKSPLGVLNGLCRGSNKAPRRHLMGSRPRSPDPYFLL